MQRPTSGSRSFCIAARPPLSLLQPSCLICTCLGHHRGRRGGISATSAFTCTGRPVGKDCDCQSAGRPQRAARSLRGCSERFWHRVKPRDASNGGDRREEQAGRQWASQSGKGQSGTQKRRGNIVPRVRGTTRKTGAAAGATASSLDGRPGTEEQHGIEPPRVAPSDPA